MRVDRGISPDREITANREAIMLVPKGVECVQVNNKRSGEREAGNGGWIAGGCRGPAADGSDTRAKRPIETRVLALSLSKRLFSYNQVAGLLPSPPDWIPGSSICGDLPLHSPSHHLVLQ